MQASKNKESKKDDDEKAVLDAIAAMPDPDRIIGEKLHSIIMTNAPNLLPRTWYGMPSYSNGNKIVCFFRSKKKFGERYMTFGFNDVAKLDEGAMWPVSFALKDLTADVELKIADLMKKAIT